LQIDDPALTGFYGRSSTLPVDQKKKQAEMYIEALNHALRGIPPEQVRFHTCYGINEGPRVYDTPLSDIIGLMLKVNARALSFEAANPRHEHEYHVFESVKVPDGTVLIPGVVTHASNIVEHPEWIAERLMRYANVIGRENVMAGADCGFSSQATFNPEVHPTVVWAKFKAMAEGARLASERLWAR
jgi:5-methyltetrahydropteroyltriglutamate--homocysteine methyltransferase